MKFAKEVVIQLLSTAIRAGLTALATMAAFSAGAQSDYPSRPVRIVVPYAPGGGTDINARQVQPKLYARWGHSPVIDNRPGGNAMIGADIVAKSAPDGYTVLMSASSEIATNVSLFKKMPYDPLRDLLPVTLVSNTPVVIVAHPSTGVKSIKELVATARTRNYAYSSVGTASPQHLVGEWLKNLAKIDMTHIPFKGALAVTSGQRSTSMPDTPTMKEVATGRWPPRWSPWRDRARPG